MTEKKVLPPAPSALGDRGRAFWLTVHTHWLLNVDEVELLTEVCRTVDVCEDLQAVLNRDGVMAVGSMGQARTHPALAELRGSRLLLGRLLAQLSLPDPADGVMSSPASARARKAAKARWVGHNAAQA